MAILKEIITNSPEETEAVGLSLAEMLKDDASLPSFVALYGDLGVGKTAFVRGFTKVFSPNALVRSPTFALVNEYPTKNSRRVFHFDMYRITNEDDLYSICTSLCMFKFTAQRKHQRISANSRFDWMFCRFSCFCKYMHIFSEKGLTKRQLRSIITA